jgi:hypothetical protein
MAKLLSSLTGGSCVVPVTGCSGMGSTSVIDALCEAWMMDDVIAMTGFAEGEASKRSSDDAWDPLPY